MQRLMTGAMKQAVDAYAIQKMGVSGQILMEHAAEKVANHVEMLLATAPGSVLAVCGGGNNGGDGIAAARILRERGIDARIFLAGDETEKKMTPASALEWELAKKAGVPRVWEADFSEYSILIDALFGTGLSRDVGGPYRELIFAMNEVNALVVAVDLPSGIDGEDGTPRGIAVKADVTVTFGAAPAGLYFYPGCSYAGEIFVEDIGFPKEAMDSVGETPVRYTIEDLERLPRRPDHSNKGTFGRVLVIAGNREISGACYLAAKAAYRTGAGLVRMLTHAENRQILAVLLPEALLSTYTEISKREDLQKVIDWATVLVVGPGMGKDSFAEMLFSLACASGKPMVIDADAIHLMAKSGRKVPGNAILTPHVREMADFMGCSVQEVSGNLLRTARIFARNHPGTLLLKDARSLIVQGDRLCVNTSGNAGMATGGSGDVLSGIIGGLLAQGMQPYDAACLGAYLHGLAGEEAAKTWSRRGLMAGDLLEALPKVLARAEAEDSCKEREGVREFS